VNRLVAWIRRWDLQQFGKQKESPPQSKSGEQFFSIKKSVREGGSNRADLSILELRKESIKKIL